MMFFKKILALFLLIIIVQIPVAFGATDATKHYDEVIKVLTALDVISDYKADDERLEQIVSRQEIVDFIINIIGFGNGNVSTASQNSDQEDLFAETEKTTSQAGQETTEKSRFTDVKPDFKGFENLNKAVDLGLISGFSDGTFKPDEPIYYEQAVKILVKVLGYGRYAEAKGSYPVGYLSVASDKKITNNVVGMVGKSITKGDLFTLLYNSLEVDLLKPSALGEREEMTSIKGENFLWEYFDAVKGTGIVKANHDTTLVGASNLTKNQVMIDDTLYNIGKSDIADYLGYRVAYYAKESENDDVKTILLITDLQSKNNVVKIDTENISMVDGIQTNNGFVEYFEDKDNSDKVKKVNIPVNAKYIYNKMSLSLVNNIDLMPTNGGLTLIDNNYDGVYDIVLISNYEIYVVDYITKDYDVYEKYGKPKVRLDVYDLNTNVTIIKNNKSIDFKDITEWNILQIAKAKNNKKIEVHVFDTMISDAVVEKGDDYILIGKDKYDVASNIISNTIFENLKAGDTANFYLDGNGKIAGIRKKAVNGILYGYFIRLKEVTGINKNLQFQILVDDRKEPAKSYDGVDKIRLNDESKTNKEIQDSFTEPQVVAFKLNADGKLTDIYKAIIKDDKKYDLDNFSRDYVSGGVAYNNFMNRYGEAYTATQETLVILPPKDSEKLDTDKYGIGGRNLVKTNVEDYKNVEVYDANEDRNIAVLVVRDAAGSTLVQGYPALAYVESISTVVDEEGLEVPKIYYYVNQKIESKIAEKVGVADSGSWGETKKITELKPGDIIQFGTDLEGEISALRVLFDSSKLDLTEDKRYMYKSNNSTTGAASEVMVHAEMYVSFDRVRERSAGSITLHGKKGTDGKIITFNLNSSISVMIFDRNTKKYTKGSIKDINMDDEVFVRAEWQMLRDVVIYR